MSPGFAGIDNPLYYLDRTLMLFGNARDSRSGIVRELSAATITRVAAGIPVEWIVLVEGEAGHGRGTTGTVSSRSVTGRWRWRLA